MIESKERSKIKSKAIIYGILTTLVGVVFFGNKRFSFILRYITPYFIGHLCRRLVSTFVSRFNLLGLTGTFLGDPATYKLGFEIS